jgi:hypothetical protein
MRIAVESKIEQTRVPYKPRASGKMGSMPAGFSSSDDIRILCSLKLLRCSGFFAAENGTERITKLGRWGQYVWKIQLLVGFLLSPGVHRPECSEYPA